MSEKAGVPQGHISKIENGAVDLRLSSLIELARVLDLELTLVPRKTVPAIQSIVRSSEGSASRSAAKMGAGFKELVRMQTTLADLSKTIQSQLPSVEIQQIQRQVRELQNFKINMPEIETLRKVNKTLQAFKNNKETIDAVRKSLSQIDIVRNALAHASISIPKIERPLSAYSLGEDDDG